MELLGSQVALAGMEILKRFNMIAEYKTISSANFLNFCKDNIPIVSDLELKLKRYDRSGLEIEYFPAQDEVGMTDQFWENKILLLADMVSYGCILCRYPAAIPSVTLNWNGNFFGDKRISNLRALGNIREYGDNFANASVDIINFNNDVIAKVTCNYMIRP